jgi:elongation factor G
LLGDINRRRGTIVSIEAKNGQTVLNAQVPLAEMFGYATAIRSLSKGPRLVLDGAAELRASAQ